MTAIQPSHEWRFRGITYGYATIIRGHDRIGLHLTDGMIAGADTRHVFDTPGRIVEWWMADEPTPVASDPFDRDPSDEEKFEDLLTDPFEWTK